MFTPPPNTPTDERGIRIRPPTPPVHTVHSRSASPEGHDGNQGPPGLMDTEESDDELNAIENEQINVAISRSLEVEHEPRGGSYGQPNSRGEIPFNPNGDYRNEGHGQVHPRGEPEGSAEAQNDQNSRPFHEGSTLLSRTLMQRSTDGGLIWRTIVRNADNTVRVWQQYQPAGSEPLTEVMTGRDRRSGNDDSTSHADVEGEQSIVEVPDAVQVEEDRPRTPRGMEAEAPGVTAAEEDDGDVLMIRHMVGRRIVAEAGPNYGASGSDGERIVLDGERIGLAAIEDQRRQQAIEEAQLRQACLNSMDDNVQAEADNYLAEVDAEDGHRGGEDGEEILEEPPVEEGQSGDGADGAMDQS